MWYLGNISFCMEWVFEMKIDKNCYESNLIAVWNIWFTYLKAFRFGELDSMLQGRIKTTEVFFLCKLTCI